MSEFGELVGIRVSDIEKFDVLLDGIKTALPTTYGLVCKFAGVPCMSVEIATQKDVNYCWVQPRKINLSS